VTIPAPQSADRPTLSEICDLIAWARRLSDIEPGNIPAAEMAAYQAAKHDLLARLSADDPAEQDEK
jgi:hypothetical protein